jgi:DNA/RNA endonuclease YhcR with UshA esterase domain
MNKNITVIEMENIDGSTTEHVIIDNGDGSFTSMTKAHYDELEAAKENGTIS